MTTTERIEHAIKSSFGKSPKARKPDFDRKCAAIAKDIVATRVVMQDSARTIEEHFPPGNKIRERNARVELDKFARSVNIMTPTERFAMFARLATTETYSILGVSNDAHISELHKEFNKLCALLESLETGDTIESERKRSKSLRASWLMNAMATSWYKHFDERPKASSNSPFYHAFVAVGGIVLDETPTSHTSVAKILEQTYFPEK